MLDKLHEHNPDMLHYYPRAERAMCAWLRAAAPNRQKKGSSNLRVFLERELNPPPPPRFFLQARSVLSLHVLAYTGNPLARPWLNGCCLIYTAIHSGVYRTSFYYTAWSPSYITNCYHTLHYQQVYSMYVHLAQLLNLFSHLICVPTSMPLMCYDRGHFLH